MVNTTLKWEKPWKWGKTYAPASSPLGLVPYMYMLKHPLEAFSVIPLNYISVYGL